MIEEEVLQAIAEEERKIQDIKERFENDLRNLRKQRDEEISMHRKTRNRLQKFSRSKYFRQHYQKRRDAGLCAACGSPSGEYSHCEACRRKDKERYQSGKEAPTC